MLGRSHVAILDDTDIWIVNRRLNLRIFFILKHLYHVLTSMLAFEHLKLKYLFIPTFQVYQSPILT